MTNLKEMFTAEWAYNKDCAKTLSHRGAIKASSYTRPLYVLSRFLHSFTNATLPVDTLTGCNS